MVKTKKRIPKIRKPISEKCQKQGSNGTFTHRVYGNPFGKNGFMVSNSTFEERQHMVNIFFAFITSNFSWNISDNFFQFISIFSWSGLMKRNLTWDTFRTYKYTATQSMHHNIRFVQNTLGNDEYGSRSYSIQSQAFNIYTFQLIYAKMSSMNFYTWKRSLKTRLYYNRN